MLFLNPFSCFALDKHTQNKTITKLIIGTGEWKPHHSKELKHFGVGNHIVSEAFKEMGIKVEFLFRPWKRLLLESTEGDVDCVATWGSYAS